MKGIDASYHYEGYHLYKTEDLPKVKPQGISMSEWQFKIDKSREEAVIESPTKSKSERDN